MKKFFLFMMMLILALSLSISLCACDDGDGDDSADGAGSNDDGTNGGTGNNAGNNSGNDSGNSGDNSGNTGNNSGGTGNNSGNEGTNGAGSNEPTKLIDYFVSEVALDGKTEKSFTYTPSFDGTLEVIAYSVGKTTAITVTNNTTGVSAEGSYIASVDISAGDDVSVALGGDAADKVQICACPEYSGEEYEAYYNQASYSEKFFATDNNVTLEVRGYGQSYRNQTNEAIFRISEDHRPVVVDFYGTVRTVGSYFDGIVVDGNTISLMYTVGKYGEKRIPSSIPSVITAEDLSVGILKPMLERLEQTLDVEWPNRAERYKTYFGSSADTFDELGYYSAEELVEYLTSLGAAYNRAREKDKTLPVYSKTEFSSIITNITNVASLYPVYDYEEELDLLETAKVYGVEDYRYINQKALVDWLSQYQTFCDGKSLACAKTDFIISDSQKMKYVDIFKKYLPFYNEQTPIEYFIKAQPKGVEAFVETINAICTVKYELTDDGIFKLSIPHFIASPTVDSDALKFMSVAVRDMFANRVYEFDVSYDGSVTEIAFAPERTDGETSNGLVFKTGEDGAELVSFGICIDKSIVIPDEYEGLPVMAIQDGAFDSCNWIEEVIIPDTVVTVGAEAFEYCQSLKSVVIPKSVIALGGYIGGGYNDLNGNPVPAEFASAFTGCNALTDIYYEGTEEEWAAISEGVFTAEQLANITVHYNYTY